MSKPIDLNYSEHFASDRSDGRNHVMMAAYMAKMRDCTAELALPESLDADSFEAWRKAVKARLTRQLNLPVPTSEPTPVKLSSVKRDGYTVEKWELYPDRFTAVPFLALIPDHASEENPVPGVICFPDGGETKEFIAGEPALSDHPNFNSSGNPDTDRMALYIVQNGMATFVFDNPGDGECSVLSDPGAGNTGDYMREILSQGLLEMGLSYIGVSVFQKQRFLEQLSVFPWIDKERIGLCAKGMGADAAVMLGVLEDSIKCMVFNDILKDEGYLFGSVTEHHSRLMENDIAKCQIVPGKTKACGYQDLLAAFAPRPLALTEGGADALVSTVKRAYEATDASDKLAVSYYPEFADPGKRTLNKLPETGMSKSEFYKYSYVYGIERTFRKEPALALFRACFGL